jgi:hypothetical protein
MTRTLDTTHHVIPAQAGTHLYTLRPWVPAFAGMTGGKKRTTT